MIARLRGKLLYKDASHVVVECGGVGYGADMSVASLATVGALGESVDLWVHTHVAQDSLRLYAFLDEDERSTFEILIKTTGVGPKLALAILSTLAPAELREVVAKGDAALLVRIPGVGKKKAERLLLELRDRLPKVVGSPQLASDLLSDLVSALVNLGFKERLAEQVAKQARENHPEERDPALLVREALRLTTR